ncbi:proprotein convertase P-domain-containing protein [Luminiphilus sp.]|nr:proprotein convertase P-domain-containing protein [Luminiphilus sp.]
MAVSFTLIDITDIIFLDPATDNLTNSDGRVLIGESQTVINNVIGAANYDVGHTFSTGGGGLATLRTPCKDASKARGITGRGNPIGDPFDVDYVAHEIGHQFGGNHTYNGTVCNTGVASAAYEPGSGSTIQAYAGICGSDNLQANSDPIFAAVSFDEMIAYVEDSNGASCPSSSAINSPQTGATNNAPAVNAGGDYTVPSSTPLILSGSATDADGDALTYLWEQRDLGPKRALGAADNGSSPLFRVWTPISEPVRYLPKLSTVVAGTQDSSEILPMVAREMDFRLTARDGNGGVSSDDMVVNIQQTPSYLMPFSVIEPNAGGESLGGTATVRWNLANTNSAPISTGTIDFYLSTNSGATFSSTPFDSKPNTGYARVTFPSGIQTSTARLMVKGQSNIFYDVSNADFTLNSDAAATPETPTPSVWSLVPTNGGAELYFGEGSETDGSAGIYQGYCRPTPDEFEKSVSPGTAINDNQTITSTVTVTSLGVLPSTGLALDLNISHTYRGDLTITVISPIGTTASVSTNPPASGNNVVRQDLKLDEFAGEAPAGVWTLRISDGASGDVGALNSWGLSGYGTINGSAVTSNRDRSPISFTGLTNDWPYSCEITALDNNVTPMRGSRTVTAGSVTPSTSPNTFTVTPSAETGGSVAPNDSIPVTSGNTLALAISADAGYQINTVAGTCGGALSNSTYTTNSITGNCTVVAKFNTLTPGAPSITQTDHDDSELSIFVSPGSGGTPTSYIASCTDGANTYTGTSASSRISLTGLTNGVPYTCTVTATNSRGTSLPSTATNPIIPEETISGLPIWLLYQATQ